MPLPPKYTDHRTETAAVNVSSQVRGEIDSYRSARGPNGYRSRRSVWYFKLIIYKSTNITSPHRPSSWLSLLTTRTVGRKQPGLRWGRKRNRASSWFHCLWWPTVGRVSPRNRVKNIRTHHIMIANSVPYTFLMD